MYHRLSRGFIGRKHELEYLLSISRSVGIPSRELIFVCGPSGIGKTRLALETIDNLEKKNILSIYTYPLPDRMMMKRVH